MEITNIIDKSAINNELINSKINSIKDINTSKINSSDKAELAKAARGFEAIFINMMLKEMKLGEFSNSSENDSGFGADTLKGYTYLQLSEQMANSGNGIGIAQMIYSHLSGGDSLSSIPQINSAKSFISKIKQSISNDTPNVFNIRKKEGDNSINLTNPLLKKDIRIANDFNLKSDKEKPNTVIGNFFERVQNRLGKYQEYISKASDKYNVPEYIIKGIITAESAGKNDARSPVGAKGLMQLMDGTAKDLGVSNSFDPEQNIMAGTKYIKQMLDKFGNLEKALAAYNAGPGNVNKYGGIPPFKETQNYVVKVKKYAEMHKG